MDYDSSTKFISSLAKFLQSLCNGYVEFDNGVQVIGHLYLSVDTGKTIDYILNEKVCKTDENSVTFISNSFHAQPAERPKPHKKSHDKAESKSEEVNESILGQAEPKSTNYGTLPHRGAQNSPHSQNLKRSFSPSLKNLKSEPSPSKSGRQSPRHKKIRTEPLDQNLSSQTSNPASENSIPSQPSPAAESVTPATLTAPNTDVSHGTNYNEPYQQSFFHPGDDENSMAEESEERDIKPSIDTDVTFIKEEFASSSSCSQSGNQSRDRSHGDDSALYPVYQSNSAFPAVNFPGQASFGAASGSQRSNFNTSGDRSAIYTSGSSQMDGGESSGDPSVRKKLRRRGLKEFLPETGSVLSESRNNLTMKGSLKLNKSKSCSLCNLKFPSASDLRTHVQSVHMVSVLLSDLEYNPSNAKFTCAFCPSALFNYPDILQHLDQINSAENSCFSKTIQTNFHCGICNFESNSVELFKYHMDNEHEELKYNFSPSKFSKDNQFDTNQDLSDMEITNGTPVRNRFRCNHCNNTYSDMKGLKRHLAKVMGVTFWCEQCNKRFSRDDVFRKHQKTFHSLEFLGDSVTPYERSLPLDELIFKTELD